MGGNGLDERVFATLENLRDHGGDAWWLHLTRCRACGQHWLVAQEERIYDDYFLRRLALETSERILVLDEWPDDFAQYESVLALGRKMGSPCVYLDRRSPALIDTITDLRRERATITDDRISDLLGISTRDVAQLGRAFAPARRSWRNLFGLAK